MNLAHLPETRSRRDAVQRSPASTPGQHSSHLELLAQVVPSPRFGAGDTIDAIVVPTAREVSALDHAIWLAGQLACPLIALCSRRGDAHAAVESGRRGYARIIAVDVTATGIPEFTTSRLMANESVARHTDTSAKRNVGLAISRMLGWRRVLFLDDDIEQIDIADLTAAATLLQRYSAVGLRNKGFADNSVVCHANRDTGGVQGTFVGAGALLIPALATTSFFPDIYNEDWFFLLHGNRLANVAMSGTCSQRAYDPYLDPDRARQEEFGDCMAEGIFSLLDNRRPITDADADFWRVFLGRRTDFIDDIVNKIDKATADERRDDIVTALRASRSSLDDIAPDLCVEYLARWRADRRMWREYVSRLRPQESPEAALTFLGLKSHA